MKEQPLWHRICFDACYTEVVRAVGYASCPCRELGGKLVSLYERFGKERVDSAVYDLVLCDGVRTRDPKPLAEVRLSPEARKASWQILGPPPEHPEYAHFHSPDPWPAPPPVGGGKPAPEEEKKTGKKRSRKKSE